MSIDRQRKRNDRFRVIKGEGAFGDGEIDSIVDIEGIGIGVSDSAAADIGFIGDNQSGGDGIHGNARTFIMVTYSGNDKSEVIGRHIHFFKDTKSHEGTTLGVVNTIDEVSDIMKISGDTNEFDIMLGVIESFKDKSGIMTDDTDMSE